MKRAPQPRRANRAAGTAVAVRNVRKPLPASMVVSTNPLVAPVATEVACIGTPLRDLAPDTGSPLVLRLNGQWILREHWGRPVLPGDVIEWHVIPMGGGDGNGSRQVLTIIAALVITYFTAGAGSGTLVAALGGGATGALGAAAIGAVATIAASALINALIPIQQPTLGTVQSAGSVYNVSTAANQARLTQPIPVIYGRMRVYPDYAGNPYAVYDDNNDQYFMAVYCIGQGCYTRERLEIDDTWLDHYQDVQYEWLEPGQLPTLADSNVVIAPEVIGQPLKSGRLVGGFNACKAKLQVVDIEIDLLFPAGLGIADNNGNMTQMSAAFRADARYVDDFGAPIGNWFTLQNETITAATRTPLRKSFRYTLPQPGRVAVRMVRTSIQSDNVRYLEEAQWGGLKAYLGNPAPLSATATHLAVRIRASEQLSGLTQRKISAIVRRKLRTWSVDDGWSCDYADYANYTETRNPFWARLDKLSDPVYGDRMPDSRIDLVTHAELAAVADARQDRLDIIFDSRVTSIDADRTMLQVARSVPFQRAGVCTLTRDQLQTLPVTAYTSRDIVPGSMSIGYALATEKTADAVIVEYFDNRAWDWLPIQCNAPGVTDPQNIVRQRLLGISGAKHAEREGLYLAAQNVYRRKFPEFTTEMQGLVPAYGSLALFHPAMPGWGQAGDVAFWDEPTLTMGLTEPVAFTPGANHFISLRRDDNTLTDPISVTPGPTVHDIVLATAPDFELVLDDGTRERPKYIFGAEGEHRIPVLVLSIMKKGRDSSGATRIGIKTVAEDDRLHAVDNHLLPGPGDIQDPVDSAASTGTGGGIDSGDELGFWVRTPDNNYAHGNGSASFWTQDESVGNPAPSYLLRYDEIHTSVDDEPYAYRDFGTLGAPFVRAKLDFMFGLDTSCKQAVFHVAAQNEGQGTLVMYASGGEEGTNTLQIRNATKWGWYGSTALSSVAAGALAAATWYRFEVTVTANGSGSYDISASLYSGATLIAQTTATADVGIDGFYGMTAGDPKDAGSIYGTYYDNVIVETA